MKRKVNIIFLHLFIITWMLIIFLFSSDTGNTSDNKSKGLIEPIIVNTLKITNKLGITDKKLEKNEIQSLVDKLNYPIRKIAHMSVYFILAILLIISLHIKNHININKNIYITLTICFLYACTDEFHQKFIGGRTGQFSDVLIDTLGASFGLLLWTLIMKHKEKSIK